MNTWFIDILELRMAIYNLRDNHQTMNEFRILSCNCEVIYHVFNITLNITIRNQPVHNNGYAMQNNYQIMIFDL